MLFFPLVHVFCRRFFFSFVFVRFAFLEGKMLLDLVCVLCYAVLYCGVVYVGIKSVLKVQGQCKEMCLCTFIHYAWSLWHVVMKTVTLSMTAWDHQTGLHGTNRQDCMGPSDRTAWDHQTGLHGTIRQDCMGPSDRTAWDHQTGLHGTIRQDCMGPSDRTAWDHQTGQHGTIRQDSTYQNI